MDGVVTISTDEYKELLSMKAKYEELQNYIWFLQETITKMSHDALSKEVANVSN